MERTAARPVRPRSPPASQQAELGQDLAQGRHLVGLGAHERQAHGGAHSPSEPFRAIRGRSHRDEFHAASHRGSQNGEQTTVESGEDGSVTGGQVDDVEVGHLLVPDKTAHIDRGSRQRRVIDQELVSAHPAQGAQSFSDMIGRRREPGHLRIEKKTDVGALRDRARGPAVDRVEPPGHRLVVSVIG